MCCRGRADCRPGRTDHRERGKRLGGAGLLVATRQGPMPADAAGAWRSPRSSPSRGKPGTWRRRTAGRRREKPFGRSGVNTSAPLDAKEAEERVLGWQTKLHRWAVEDGEKRFDDLFNLVCDPATLLVAWERSATGGRRPPALMVRPAGTSSGAVWAPCWASFASRSGTVATPRCRRASTRSPSEAPES